MRLEERGYPVLWLHKRIGPGEKAPEIVNVFIEIPMNSSVKYEYD